MNDLNDMEQDNNRAGPSSHDPAQHPGKFQILLVIYDFWFCRSETQGLFFIETMRILIYGFELAHR